MGEANLAKLPAPPTEVKSSTDHINVLHDALYGNIVMRNSSGVVTDGAGDIGRPSDGRPENIYVKNSIILGGSIVQEEDVGKSKNVILSGKAKTSGYPNFLSVGASNKVNILAASTNLKMNINGALYTLAADRETASLALAPSTNNTALVNDSNASGQQWTRTTGEYGWKIPIDTAGSEITSRGGEVHAVKIGSEYMLGMLTSSEIFPLIRGIGGVRSAAYSDNATVTLMKAHYIFLNKDMVTINTTTTYPRATGVAPTLSPTPSNGDYWYDSINNVWKKYNGATWDITDDIFLGIGICDSSGLVAVEPMDFYVDWKDDLEYQSAYTLNSTTVRFTLLNVIGVKNKIVKISRQVLVGLSYDADITTMLESGLTEQASTWYYIYFDLENFTFVFSSEAPRHPGYNGRKGYYHPRQYWRCVAFAYNNSGADFEYTTYCPKSGKLYLQSNSYYRFINPISVTTYFLESRLPSVIADVEIKEQPYWLGMTTMRYVSSYASLETPSAGLPGSDIYFVLPSASNVAVAHSINVLFVSGTALLKITSVSGTGSLYIYTCSGTFFL